MGAVTSVRHLRLVVSNGELVGPPPPPPAQPVPAHAAEVVSHRGLKTGFMVAGTEYNAEVTPGVQIRVWGVEANHVNGPQTFDRVFRVGDTVEHGSYNLAYTGRILAISAATVTVERADIGAGNKRMKLAEFVWRNWNLDLAKVERRNAEWLD